MTVPYLGHQQTMSIGGTNTVGFSSVAKHAVHLEREGTRGTRSHDVDDVAQGPYVVSGVFRTNPTNAFLNVIETYAIGASGTLAESLTDFTHIVNKGAAIQSYANCKVDYYVLRGRAGGLLETEVGIEGLAESTGSDPAEPADLAPFIFSDITFTYAGNPYEIEGFELRIDHQLVKDRFQNKTYRTDLPEGDRIVTLRTEHSYSSNTSGLYNLAVVGAIGTLVCTGNTGAAAVTRTYTFAKIQAPAEGVEVNNKGPIPLVVNWVARADGATDEVVRT